MQRAVTRSIPLCNLLLCSTVRNDNAVCALLLHLFVPNFVSAKSRIDWQKFLVVDRQFFVRIARDLGCGEAEQTACQRPIRHAFVLLYVAQYCSVGAYCAWCISLSRFTF